MLLYHAESDYLFLETNDLKLNSAFNNGCVDVTNEPGYLRRYIEQEKNKAVIAASLKHRIEFHRDLIDSQNIPSCLNCGNYLEKSNTCVKYKAQPPAETLVYSCGSGWEADIPF